MRSFSEILTESKKSYPFKIGIAGELPEDFKSQLETMLKKFDAVKISNGKKTPIQERPLDFPNLENTHVTYFDVELNYPTTPQVLGEYITAWTRLTGSHVMVRTPNDPLEVYQEAKKDEVYEPLLTKEDLGGDSAQDSVGGNRVMELLKELEKDRKEREHDPAAAAPVGESSDIKDSVNTESVIGS